MGLDFSNSFIFNRKVNSMRKSDFRAKLVCSNYAMKKAYRHWDNFEDSNHSDLDEIDTAIDY